ncbi:hypothetical protein J6590_085068 [Homalodisca vitripennis]|nr:hypothetical protein J6590_085068 [Homalodisca vitripennis]
MEAERVFLACTDYAPVPAGLFESLSTQGENYELALLYSLPPCNFAGHPRCSLIGPAVSNKENNNRNKTSSNQFKADNLPS